MCVRRGVRPLLRLLRRRVRHLWLPLLRGQLRCRGRSLSPFPGVQVFRNHVLMLSFRHRQGQHVSSCLPGRFFRQSLRRRREAWSGLFLRLLLRRGLCFVLSSLFLLQRLVPGLQLLWILFPRLLAYPLRPPVYGWYDMRPWYTMPTNHMLQGPRAAPLMAGAASWSAPSAVAALSAPVSPSVCWLCNRRVARTSGVSLAVRTSLRRTPSLWVMSLKVLLFFCLINRQRYWMCLLAILRLFYLLTGLCKHCPCLPVCGEGSLWAVICGVFSSRRLLPRLVGVYVHDCHGTS